MLINLFSVLGAPKNGSEMQNIFAGGVRNDAHKMQNIFVSVRSTMSAKATIFASALPNMGGRCKMSLVF